jgi:hypothetical protein
MGNLDAALSRGGGIDGCVAAAGGTDQLEPGQAFENVFRERRALPHDADDVVREQPLDDGMMVRDVIFIDIDPRALVDGSPVGQTEGDTLVIVQDRHAQRVRLAAHMAAHMAAHTAVIPPSTVNTCPVM